VQELIKAVLALEAGKPPEADQEFISRVKVIMGA
jgi:hypothetical protein